VQGVVDSIQRQLDVIIREGYSPSQIIAQLLTSVLAGGCGCGLSEVQRGKLLVQLSEVDRRITEVSLNAAFRRVQVFIFYSVRAGQRRFLAVIALLHFRARMLGSCSALGWGSRTELKIA
jgi:hypothetical protein